MVRDEMRYRDHFKNKISLSFVLRGAHELLFREFFLEPASLILAAQRLHWFKVYMILKPFRL